MWDTAKAELRRKFITKQVFSRKEGDPYKDFYHTV